jgi:hypothetical protein
MISLSTLEKSVKILDKIKELDKEIIEIEQAAMLLADTESNTIEMTLSFNQKDEQKPIVEEPKKHDEYCNDVHSWINERVNYIRLSMGLNESPKNNQNKHTLSKELTVNVGMQILGIVLAGKIDRRNNLISQLNNLGVQL